MSRLKSPSLILAAFLTCTIFLPSAATMAAREDTPLKSPESDGQPSPVLEVPDISEEIDESYKGYPSKERRIGTPTDVEWDLDHSFPKPDSLLELILRSRQVRTHEKP